MSQEAVLFVSDGRDEHVDRCAETLRTAGIPILWAADVYAAMARLTGANPPRRLVVDVRGLDAPELNFIQLAPRYFTEIDVLVPLLPGAADRLTRVRGRYQALGTEALMDFLLGIRSALPAPEDGGEVAEWIDSGAIERIPANRAAPSDRLAGQPLVEQPAIAEERSPTGIDDNYHEISEGGAATEIEAAIGPTAGAPASRASTGMRHGLSTDAGSAELTEGPSLHEAVRSRMAAAGTPAPPRRMPPRDASARPAPESDARLTPEELDALLREGMTDVNASGEGGSFGGGH